jgi:hypothetical protein
VGREAVRILPPDKGMYMSGDDGEGGDLFRWLETSPVSNYQLYSFGPGYGLDAKMPVNFTVDLGDGPNRG